MYQRRRAIGILRIPLSRDRELFNPSPSERLSMQKLISTLCLGLALAIAIPPVQALPKGEACRSAVDGMQEAMAQENGVSVSGFESFKPVELGYGERDRTLGYTFSMEPNSGAINLLNSPVTMQSYAQQVANECRSVAMVTFWIDAEGGWGDTFGLDSNGKMFQFKCVGAGSPEARRQPLPWGSIICG